MKFILMLSTAILSLCSIAVNSQDTNTVTVQINDQVKIQDTNTVSILVDDCPNPCPWRYSGFVSIPNANCKLYAQCREGNPIGEFECFGDYIFVESKGGCEFVSDSECQPVSCPLLPTYTPTESPTISESPTITQTSTNLVSIFVPPTRPRPTPLPTPVYFSFLPFVESRRQSIEATVLQNTSGPSTAYTMEGLMSALDIVVNKFPSDKTFYVGDGDGNAELTGLQYGLVNFAAFLSQAMSEGIRMDSCDEWNTDYIFQDNTEKFPLSNACGQYERAYDLEVCQSTEPFECPLDMEMEVTAVDRDQNFMVGKTGPPAFSCKPYVEDTFPGFYDLFDDVIVKNAYSNSLGRTDIAGCCWWKRGALMTGGRCAFGKLNKYVGKEAADDRGIYVYPDIDFCSNPEVICDHSRTHELRWLIGFLDWSGRVETYVDSNTGWSFMEELKKFSDNGMVGDGFIDAVTNIVTKKCHNLDLCADKWGEDPEKDYFGMKRRLDFRNIMTNVFNLPLTAPPTVSPTPPLPTDFPTNSVLYSPPAPLPTAPIPVMVLSPNSTRRCNFNKAVLASVMTLVTWCVWL